MPSTVKRLLAAVNYPRTLPVFLCAMCSKHKRLIQMDVARWNEIDQIPFNFFESINWHMTYKKEFRNLIQHRLKNPSRTFLAMCHYAIARILWKPMESLYIYTEDIGGGLYIQHGFATIITAKKLARIAESISKSPLVIKTAPIRRFWKIMWRLPAVQKSLAILRCIPGVWQQQELWS